MSPPIEAAPQTTDCKWEANSCDSPVCVRARQVGTRIKEREKKRTLAQGARARFTEKDERESTPDAMQPKRKAARRGRDIPWARSTTSASAMTFATAMAAEATSIQEKPCHTPVTHVDMKNHAAAPTIPAKKMYGLRLQSREGTDGGRSGGQQP